MWIEHLQFFSIQEAGTQKARHVGHLSTKKTKHLHKLREHKLRKAERNKGIQIGYIGHLLSSQLQHGAVVHSGGLILCLHRHQDPSYTACPVWKKLLKSQIQPEAPVTGLEKRRAKQNEVGKLFTKIVKMITPYNSSCNSSCKPMPNCRGCLRDLLLHRLIRQSQGGRTWALCGAKKLRQNEGWAGWAHHKAWQVPAETCSMHTAGISQWFSVSLYVSIYVCMHVYTHAVFDA